MKNKIEGLFNEQKKKMDKKKKVLSTLKQINL